MINDYANEFNVSKEVLDALPKNNVKNRTKYIAEVDNLLKKYLSDREDVLEEIEARYKEYNNYEINPELEVLNQKIWNEFNLLPILNEKTTSYEKSGLDRIFYSLDHFYNSSLEVTNENIFASISTFEKVGVELEPDDFVYSIYTSTYINEVFLERQNGINSVKLKTLFDSLYWKCPDIIKQITINFKYLFYKYKKTFDNYFANQKMTLMQNKGKDIEGILDEYIELKKRQDTLILEDDYLICNKFLNHLLDFKNYEPVQIDKYYKMLLKEDTPINDTVNMNILKLNESLKEYKSYLKYKYIVDDIKNLYKEKEKYTKIAAPKKKEIEKIESKLISTSKKLNKMIAKNKKFDKIEILTNKVNNMILQVEGLYKEYEQNLFLERVSLLTETASIYEALDLALSNYRYIHKIIKNNDESLNNTEIDRIINEIRCYLCGSELDIIKNIYIAEERDIAMVIFDKYNLLGLNITPEMLDEGSIDSLLDATTTLVNKIHFEKININVDNIKFIFNALDIVGKKEWSIAKWGLICYTSSGDKMKKILKFILGIVITIYVIVAVGLTFCLLNYNEYNLTVIGKNTFIIVKDDALEPDFKKGDLVVVERNEDAEIEAGDKIFFYNGKEHQVSVNLGDVVNNTKVTEKESTFTIEGNLKVSSRYIIGKAETSKVYSGLGSVLSVLESKWGFLFLIILPVLLMFIYLIYAVIVEVKNPKNGKK